MIDVMQTANDAWFCTNTERGPLYQQLGVDMTKFFK